MFRYFSFFVIVRHHCHVDVQWGLCLIRRPRPTFGRPTRQQKAKWHVVTFLLIRCRYLWGGLWKDLYTGYAIKDSTIDDIICTNVINTAPVILLPPIVTSCPPSRPDRQPRSEDQQDRQQRQKAKGSSWQQIEDTRCSTAAKEQNSIDDTRRCKKRKAVRCTPCTCHVQRCHEPTKTMPCLKNNYSTNHMGEEDRAHDEPEDMSRRRDARCHAMPAMMTDPITTVQKPCHARVRQAPCPKNASIQTDHHQIIVKITVRWMYLPPACLRCTRCTAKDQMYVTWREEDRT